MKKLYACKGLTTSVSFANQKFILLLFIGFLINIFTTDVSGQNVLDNAGLTSSSPAVAAYSIRKLSTTYLGSALEVRRSSDNTTQVIGFTGDDLNVSALMAFVGSGDGFVRTWYDQSGNGYHAVQTTNANQSKIVAAGVLILNNTRPAISFSGNTSHNLFAAIPATAYPISINVLANTGGATNISGAFVKFGKRTDGIAIGVGVTQMGTAPATLGGNIVLLKEQSSWCPSNPSVLYPSTVFTSTTVQQASGLLNNYVNGINIPLAGATTAPKPITGEFYIGGYSENLQHRYAQVKESEVIVLSSVLNLEERTVLECNQRTYFNIKTINDQTGIICSGENFSAAPGSTTYSWSNPVINPAGAITGFTTGLNQSSFGQTLFNNTGSPATATYTITPACGPSFTYTVTVNHFAVPAVAILEDYCTIGDGKVKLTVSPNTFSSYLWSNDSSTLDHLIISQSGLYTVTVTTAEGCTNKKTVNIGNELVINGNFSQGKDVGYVTDYPYVTGTANSPTYTISSNAQTAHGNFWGKDHTTGTGKFMIVNSEGSNYRIWETTVKVDSGARYYFSAWAMSLNAAGPFAKLVFNVDGQNVGTVAVLDTGVQSNTNNGWTRFYGQWDAGYRDASNENIVIRMVNLQAGNAGNDFGLDDISFSTLPPVSFFGLTLGNGGNSVCTGQTLQLTSHLQGGKAPFTYNWKNPAGVTIATTATALVLAPVDPGIYTLEAADSSNCPANAAINIILGNPKVDSIKTVNQCSGNLMVDAYGLVPSSINIKLYYKIATSPLTVDSVLVNANAAGIARFSLPVPPNNGFYANKLMTIDSVSNGSCKTYPNVTRNLGALFGNITWRGGAAGEWNLDANWCPGLPNYASDISIPTNTVITVKQNQLAVCRNLTIASGARLVLEEGAVLWNYGNLSLHPTAKIDARRGTIQLLKGDADYTLSGIMFLDSTVRHMIISPYNPIPATRKITLSNASNFFRITNTLEFQEVNDSLITNGKLILASDSTRTARVGELTSGNGIRGDVVVERFISAGRKWRLLSVPTNTTQTFKQAWQEGAATGNDNFKPGYGFKIGYSNNFTYAGLGFDMYAPGGPTVKTYNNTTDSWEGIGSTYNMLASNAGYMSFIVGNRNTATTPGNTDTTTIRTIGSLKQQTQTITIPQGKFAIVGNPYASPVALARIGRNNVQNSFVVWDPKLGGPTSLYGLGAYQYLTYDEDLAIYYAVPGGGSYPEDLSPVTSIESGLAFFVKANTDDGDGSVVFNEASKTSGDDVTVFRLGNTSLSRKMVARLYAAPAGIAGIVDAVVTSIGDQYSNSVNDEDVLKITNTGENLSIQNSGKSLVVDKRNSVAENDTIYLKLTGVRAQNYQWKMNLANMDLTGLNAWLLDKYLQTSTALDMNGETLVNFTVQNIPASYAADRFKIVFKQAGVVPVTITSISASRNSDKTVAVQWKTENELNIQNYELERSSDGRDFVSIKSALPLNNAGGRVVYNAVDTDNQPGTVFYRIKAISIGGQVQYSGIVKVAGLKTTALISVYPNPVTENQVNLQFTNAEAGQYRIALVNAAGQVVHQSVVTVANGSTSERIQLSQDIAAGRYQLTVTSPAGTKSNQQLVLQ